VVFPTLVQFRLGRKGGFPLGPRTATLSVLTYLSVLTNFGISTCGVSPQASVFHTEGGFITQKKQAFYLSTPNGHDGKRKKQPSFSQKIYHKEGSI